MPSICAVNNDNYRDKTHNANKNQPCRKSILNTILTD
jgi:hypothetical protein